MTQRPQRGVPSGWSSQQRPQPRIPGHQTRPELPVLCKAAYVIRWVHTIGRVRASLWMPHTKTLRKWLAEMPETRAHTAYRLAYDTYAAPVGSRGIPTMSKAMKCAALYVRVSTDHQSVENQIRELRQVAERRGWQVAEVYRDAGISGAKGREQRPGLDALLKDASRRRFDVVMAWAIDRLGRSLIDLLGTIQHLEAVGVDLYLDQQSIDTTTPAGRLLFRMTGAFAEFERSMIRQRVRAGLSVIKAKIERDGRFVSKAGKVRKRLGRPGAEADKLDLARRELAKGTGIRKTAKLTGLGTGTVHNLRRRMEGDDMLCKAAANLER